MVYLLWSIFKIQINYIPIAMVQFQYNREVPLSYFCENQLSIFRPHSNGGGCSRIGIIATERNLNLSNACYDV